VRRVGLTVLLSVFVIASFSGPASAAQVAHALEASIDGADVPGGPFHFLFGLAVDSSGGPSDGGFWAGELIEDQASVELHTRIYKFDEEGHYAGVALDGSNTPDGSFSFYGGTLVLNGLAIDSSGGPSSGDLYVADIENGVIDRFSEAGEYLCQITGRPQPGASECAGVTGSATPDEKFSPAGIAVDTAGNLYVADSDHNVIDEFDSLGRYVRQISDSHLTQVSEVAVDSSGNLYVVNGTLFGGEDVAKFDAAGNFVATLGGESPLGVAVDLADDHVYVSEFDFQEGVSSIVEYNAAGSALESFAKGEMSVYASMGVNQSTGRLYAGSFFFEGSRIDLISPVTTVPAVVTGPPSAVTETEATLKGEVDPDGLGDAISCRFEYGAEGRYEHSLPCSPAPPYASLTAVSADVTGLKPSTTYSFRLAAANAGAAPYSRGVSSHTPEQRIFTRGPPTVDAESASEIEHTSATVQARINPHGFDAEFRFEYVAQELFEKAGFESQATRSTPWSQLGDGLRPLSVAQGIGGLTPGVTYRFRAIARSSRGEAIGVDSEFTTRPVAVIQREWAYAHVWHATVEALIVPTGLETSCHVEYVENGRFQASQYAEAITVPCAESLSAVAEKTTVAVDLKGLELNSKYHFRFVAENASGRLFGEDETFSTFGISSFSIELLDKNGHPYTQAGGHPYVKIIHYGFNHTMVPARFGSAGSLDAFLKDLITEEPPGETAASASRTPECPGYLAEEDRCPANTQVGTLTVEYLDGGSIQSTTKGIFNIAPPEGVANRYAAISPYQPSDSAVRSDSDYGITVNSLNMSEEVRIVGVTSTIWGIPADHNGSGGPRAVTLRNPTSCDGPRTAVAKADSWQAPGHFAAISAQLPSVTGCDLLEFHPSIEWRPTSTVADSPTGLHVDVHQEQHGDPDGLDFADLKKVVIQPSRGVLLNPAGASGLVGCAPVQIGLRLPGPAHCPEASKVGRVEIDTPLTKNPLHGWIYMATPRDNPFDSLFAIYLAVDDAETGVVVKLAGEVATDAEDGRLTADFSDNPPMPVEDFKLDFFGGAHAVLRTALQCGPYVTRSTLTPWSAPQSGQPAQVTDAYAISATPDGAPCPNGEDQAPNRPEFRAGTLSIVAGAYSPFVMRLHREDGMQRFASISVTPPPGLLGRIAGLERCGDEAIATAEARTGSEELAQPSCPEGAQVGSVAVNVGAGPDPYRVEGKVYLAGAYKGAFVSLAVVVPAVAGPFDLGTVVVRTPLHVDLDSGRIAVQSDRIPTVLEGVSLDVRTILVKLDLPQFTLNPTSCSPSATGLELTSTAGQSLQMSDPFQVQGCGRLGFAPKVRMRLLGSPRRRSHPALRTALSMPPGGANLSRVTVTLPSSEFLDNSRLRDICTRAQFNQRSCPAGSVYGRSKAWSPLLSSPLEGPVYMRASAQRLPNLVAELNGEVRVAIAGHIGAADGGIRVNVKDLPDAAVSRFVMQMQGRSRGLLQNSVNVCDHPQRAKVVLEGQNGKVVIRRPRLQARCPALRPLD
jgi:hypothetical protein